MELLFILLLKHLLQQHHKLIGTAIPYNLHMPDLGMTWGDKVKQIMAVQSRRHGQKAQLIRWSLLYSLAFATNKKTT